MRRRPVWWMLLAGASVVLTLAGAVLIFTGPVVLGSVLLIGAQPLNLLTAIRGHPVATDHHGAQGPPE